MPEKTSDSIQVGILQNKVISTLGLSDTGEAPIYLGASNIEHMKSRHPDAYEKYGKHISHILNEPDYVGINPKDSSIEYVKEFVIDNEFVKVAVRVTGKGTYFARSMYVLKSSRVKNFIAKGSLKPLDN